MAGVSPGFRESVVTFGEGGALVGILTMPSKPNAGAPVVVFLNSGIIHRVGANRIYVAFARTLAAAGIASLRFDLAGIGDSERRTSGDSLQESVHGDISAAIDFLAQTHRVSRVALIGLCSGAFDAFDHARRDPRVVGAAMLDMPGPFRNWSYFAVFAGERLMHPVSWRRRVLALTRMNSLLAIARPRRKEEAAIFVPGVRSVRSRADMNVQLKSLLGRGVKLAFLFTGGLQEQYNHRLQFNISFPRAASHPSMRVEFVSWSDHTLSTRDARSHVANWLRQWVSDQLVEPVAPTPAEKPAALV